MLIALLLMLGGCNFPTTPKSNNSFSEADLWLGEAYPNPMAVGGSTCIKYDAKNRRDVKLVITNVLEQEVVTLESPTDSSQIMWAGTDNHGRVCGSGVYYYQMEAGLYSSVRKMLFIK